MCASNYASPPRLQMHQCNFFPCFFSWLLLERNGQFERTRSVSVSTKKRDHCKEMARGEGCFGLDIRCVVKDASSLWVPAPRPPARQREKKNVGMRWCLNVAVKRAWRESNASLTRLVKSVQRWGARESGTRHPLDQPGPCLATPR